MNKLSMTEAAALIKRKELSPVELLKATLNHIYETDGSLEAWEQLVPECAMEKAQHAEDQLMCSNVNELGPLHGIPFGVKDVIDTKGVVTAAGFPQFKNRTPKKDAKVIAHLKSAGAILIGKNVTTQFAQNPPSRTRNPINNQVTPGGSSSGSAVAVAAHQVSVSIGTQTGGSVVRPAAYNGIIGFKPSYGRIDNHGVFPVARSLDHVGVLVRSVADARAFLSVAGREALVPTHDFQSEERVKTLHFGLIDEAMNLCQAEVRAGVEQALQGLEAADIKIELTDLGVSWDLLQATHKVIMRAEASAVHRELIEHYPESYENELLVNLRAGLLIPASSYIRALRSQQSARQKMQAKLVGLDGFVLPTVSNVAPNLSEQTTGDRSFQNPFSLSGLPAITLPCGVSQNGLPIGLQIVGNFGHDYKLLQLANRVEQYLQNVGIIS